MFVGDGRIELKHPGTIAKENEREKEIKNQCIRTGRKVNVAIAYLIAAPPAAAILDVPFISAVFWRNSALSKVNLLLFAVQEYRPPSVRMEIIAPPAI